MKNLDLSSGDLVQGITYRQEFEILAKKMYRRLSPENTKKLWLLTSEILMNSESSNQNARIAIYEAIKIGYEKLTELNQKPR